MSYKLKEMLWEFTLSCNKQCKYCGSKNILNDEKDKKVNREHIAKEIASVKPNEVTFTGGEPSVMMDELKKCATILNKKGIVCKVLTNGNLFKNKLDKEFDDLFDCYGLSINEEKDIDEAKKFLSNIPIEKTTIITNFGSHNYLSFDKLAKFAMLFPVWQVQLTMGNEYQLDLQDIESLQEHLIKLPNNMLRVVRADNFKCGTCAAGQECCSVTWNGDVVPCLSYRAWKSDMMSQGNLFETSLSKIWKNSFKFFRNRKFIPCCKNISGIEKLEEKNKKVPFINNPSKKNDNSIFDTVFVYGVVSPDNKKERTWDFNTIITYGVVNRNNLQM
jgi:MoaA/NifB/PqqE/SkfB family radical SAM enzyme